MGTIIILNNTIALNNDKYRFILLFSEKTYLLRITIAGMNKEPVSGFTCRGPMLSVMKCYRRTLFLQGEQRMPPVFLTLPVDDRGRLQHVSQGAVSSLHDEVRNNPGGVTVRLGLQNTESHMLKNCQIFSQLRLLKIIQVIKGSNLCGFGMPYNQQMQERWKGS